MLTEIRHILFEDSDVVRAIVDYKKKKNDKLPQGSIVKVQITRVPPVLCTLELYCEESERMAEFVFNHEEIRAALVMYCMSKRIPLPAKAQKDLQAISDHITLVIALK